MTFRRRFYRWSAGHRHRQIRSAECACFPFHHYASPPQYGDVSCDTFNVTDLVCDEKDRAAGQSESVDVLEEDLCFLWCKYRGRLIQHQNSGTLEYQSENF